MHIGIIAPCSSGLLSDFLAEDAGIDIGCGGFLIATLVRALITRGHRVSVITLSPEVGEPKVLAGASLTFYAYPMRTAKRMRDLFALERRGLRAGIERAQPDILHAHWTYEFALASLDSGLPTIVTAHDSAFQQLRFAKDVYRLGRLYMQMLVLRKSRFLTAVSPYLAKSLQWLSTPKIEVIPNPIEISEPFTNGAWDAKSLNIATVLNGWGRRKNPEAAIRAFALVRQKIRNARMLMYGENFERGGIAERWTNRNKLAQNIHFCGFVPHNELKQQLRTASILLHPALEESFGMVLVEAMALGVPVIGGRSAGAVPWVLDEGSAGYLTDVCSPHSIANTVIACVTDAAERERIQQHAYNRVLADFSPDSVAIHYERVYDQVLSYRYS